MKVGRRFVAWVGCVIRILPIIFARIPTTYINKPSNGNIRTSGQNKSYVNLTKLQPSNGNIRTSGPNKSDINLTKLQPSNDNIRKSGPNKSDTNLTKLQYCPPKLTKEQETDLNDQLDKLYAKLTKDAIKKFQPSRIRAKRNTVGKSTKIWNQIRDGDNYVIPYIIYKYPRRNPLSSLNYTVNELKELRKAIKMIEKRTCIRFKEMSIADIRKYTKERINYVEFINEPGAGCHSVIARHDRGLGINKVKLETAKQKGMTYRISNYERKRSDDTWDLPFDFASITNYPPNAFVKRSSLFAIKLKNGNTKCLMIMGHNEFGSELDFLQVNLLYNCPGAVKMREDFFKELVGEQNKPVQRKKSPTPPPSPTVKKPPPSSPRKIIRIDKERNRTYYDYTDYRIHRFMDEIMANDGIRPRPAPIG